MKSFLATPSNKSLNLNPSEYEKSMSNEENELEMFNNFESEVEEQDEIKIPIKNETALNIINEYI